MSAPPPDAVIAEAREAATNGKTGLIAAHRQDGADNALFVLLSHLDSSPQYSREQTVKDLLASLTRELESGEPASLTARQTLLNGIAAVADMYGPGRMRQIAMTNLLIDSLADRTIREAVEEALDEGAER